MNTEIDAAYARRMAIWKTLLLVALLGLFADVTNAQTPPFIVQKNGQAAFSANCLEHANQSPVYNFLDSCGGPPPIDPGAYTQLAVKWVPVSLAHMIDVTQFKNLFGRINFNAPIQDYPFVSGTNIVYSDTTPKYLRLHVKVPFNPGALPHKVKGTTYLHSPWPLTARMAIVPTGGAWPTGPDSPCYKSAVHFDDQSYIGFAPVQAYGMCLEPPGSEFDVLIDLNGAGGTASWTFN